MTDQLTFRGVPVKWVDSLESASPQTIFTKDPAEMTEGQLRLLAWLIGSGPYPGKDIVAPAESGEP